MLTLGRLIRSPLPLHHLVRLVDLELVAILVGYPVPGDVGILLFALVSSLEGGISDLHILAKCPVFLQMLHTACFAVHWFICPAVKLPPHLQHCSFVFFVCWIFCCWGSGAGRVLLIVIALTWLFQFGADVRRISFWFSCPLSPDNAKFRTCAAVRTSDSSSIWIAELLNIAIKKSFMRSSSTFPRAAFEPSSRNLLKNVSRLSFGFCCTVINWNLSKVRFRGRVKVRPNSYTSSFVEKRSIMVWGFLWWNIRVASVPRDRYVRLLTFRSASSQVYLSIIGPLLLICLHSFS